MKTLTTLLLTLLLSFSAWSQQPSGEKIKAMKVAHITNALDLSSKEAQQFWPIYNAFEDEKEKLRKETQKIRRGVVFESLTDSDAKKLVKDMMALEEKKHALLIKRMNDMLDILPAKKVIRLNAAEDAFNKELLKRLRDRRQQLRKN